MRPLAMLLGHGVLFALLLFAFACGGRKRPEADFPPASVRHGQQEGVASWYGKEFDGRPTASGETFDMDGLTAAHRTLPLGTTVRVTNLDTGRSAVLKVNDRGPFIEGRVLDCSYGAARELGFAGAGLARVRIEVLKEGPGRRGGPAAAGQEIYLGRKSKQPVLDGSYCVQAGSFAVKENALRFRDLLEERLGDAYAIRFRDFYRVRAGHLPDEEAAEDLADQIRDLGHRCFVTRND